MKNGKDVFYVLFFEAWAREACEFNWEIFYAILDKFGIYLEMYENIHESVFMKIIWLFKKCKLSIHLFNYE